MAKQQEFELLGHVILANGDRLERGRRLKLEVGDDGLPTSKLYRNRVRALGEMVEVATPDPKGKGDQESADKKAAEGKKNPPPPPSS